MAHGKLVGGGMKALPARLQKTAVRTTKLSEIELETEAETVVPLKGGRDLISATAVVVASYVRNQTIPPSEIEPLIHQVYSVFAGLAGASRPRLPEELKPAVAIKNSVTPDYIGLLALRRGWLGGRMAA